METAGMEHLVSSISFKAWAKKDIVAGYLGKSCINEGMVPHLLHIKRLGNNVVPCGFSSVELEFFKDTIDLVLGHVVGQSYLGSRGGVWADQVGPWVYLDGVLIRRLIRVINQLLSADLAVLIVLLMVMFHLFRQINDCI